ncbi:Oidioi.mRNA.OKI2018_I69.chr1.g3732.t1.cds [Oikopleura dioica]|uniref:Hsp90 chaperone protein kinase-targeting subunit n=1 Tax=Oikopleura dioica TaxID=34765 RepID=A0ABN7T1X9_OIKDI|nr:Oidioi.mRNA.OKI2018_I69.chr1.g3732.t1.cds [Oikopleura dioica]
MPIDYSKWNKIEISDDEDDTHPNIHTPSLFKWRHEARVQRMEEMAKEKEQISESKKDAERALAEAKKKGLTDAELEKQVEEWKIKEREFEKKEKSQPLNVDTIGTVAQSSSRINKAKTELEIKSEEELMSDYQRFTKKWEAEIKKFGMFKRLEDSQQYLSENTYLVNEHTASFLCIYCIDLCVEEKMSLMNQVSHQAVILQFILELAKTHKIDPRGCFRQFFDKYRKNENPEYQKAFDDELAAFRERVKGRAQARIDAYLEEQKQEEESERQKRIEASPGGVDPQEVFESLPEAWQKCFETQDIPMLQKVVSETDPKVASELLDKCIKSGLWVPGPDEKGDESPASAAAAENTKPSTTSIEEQD